VLEIKPAFSRQWLREAGEKASSVRAVAKFRRPMLAGLLATGSVWNQEPSPPTSARRSPLTRLPSASTWAAPYRTEPSRSIPAAPSASAATTIERHAMRVEKLSFRRHRIIGGRKNYPQDGLGGGRQVCGQRRA
jgi:hypothetical protein